MTWHLDLRDDRHEAILSIAYDLTNLILRIEASIATAIPFGTPSPDLGKARVLLDLDAPALIFGEVPVELVDLEHGDDVDMLLHLLYGEEVATYVDHHPTVLEGRLILDAQSWDLV